MTLQSLSATLRERRAASCGPQSHVVASVADSPPHRGRLQRALPDMLEQRLVRIEAEVQGLRRGLGSVASAVRAVTRPLIGVERARPSDSALNVAGEAQSSTSAAEDLSSEALGGLEALRAEVAGVAALKLQPRLSALEREVERWQQRTAKLDVSIDSADPSPLCLADQIEERLLSVIDNRFQVQGFEPKLSDLGGVLSSDLAGRLSVVETSQECKSDTEFVAALGERLREEIGAVECMARREAELYAEQAQATTVKEMEQMSEGLQLRLSTELGTRQESFEEAVSLAQAAMTATNEWREKLREEAEIRSAADRRLNNTFQRFEQTLNCKVQAGLVSAEERLTAHLAEVRQDLHSEFLVFEERTSESEVALSNQVATSLDRSMQDTDARFAGLERSLAHASQDASSRCSSLERTLSAKVEAAVGDVSSATQASIARGMRALGSEIASERRNREEAILSARQTEQVASAQQQAQSKEVERLSEALAAGLGKCQKEDRSLWTRVRDLSRVSEKLPSELREAAELQAERAELRDKRVKKELQVHFDGRARSAREESLRELRSDLETSTRRCVEDVQEELRRELRGQLEGQVRRTLKAADDSAEKRLETALEGQREQAAACARAAAGCELSCVELQRRLAEGDTRGNETRSELVAFMDEQRVYCGFLDTEQKSYYELLRREVGTLSRLVDSTLSADVLEEHDPF